MLLETSNDLEPPVAYLAALQAGHPVILVPGDDASQRESLVTAYVPDVVVAPTGTGWENQGEAGGAPELLKRSGADCSRKGKIRAWQPTGR